MAETDIVIRSENLSKLYMIGHQQAERHSTLRDKMSASFRSVFKVKTAEQKSQEEFWALKDLSFEIKRGDVVGIIGRNGAGKSTLLKILSRITEPSKGRVTMVGRVASLLEVGTGFHPELTGRENIFLNGAILGMTRAEIRRKFDEIVAFSEIERFLDTPVKRYSSGMYVRLAFAIAAHLEPEIIVIDEVLAVGDAEFRKKCLGKMNDLATGDGRTVLFVSHDISAITTLTKRCLLLRQGGLQFDGPTAEATALYMADRQQAGHYENEKSDRPFPRIESVRVITSEAGEVHAAGKPLKVELTINHPQPIRGACISFQIINQMQQPATHHWIYDSDQPICRTAGTTTLVCELPKVRLNIGHYALRVYFSEPPGGQEFETLDGICPFEVVKVGETTLWGWRPDACVFHDDSTWEVK
ncbi:MAG: ABC transporter ATP-binding protein [Chthoniobacterales bacterium]